MPTLRMPGEYRQYPSPALHSALNLPAPSNTHTNLMPTRGIVRSMLALLIQAYVLYTRQAFVKANVNVSPTISVHASRLSDHPFVRIQAVDPTVMKNSNPNQ
jgi:hypothetical protein